MKKMSLLLLLCFSLQFVMSQENGVVVRKNFSDASPHDIATPFDRASSFVDMPESVALGEQFQTNSQTYKSNAFRRRILRPGESIIFRVENNTLVEDSSCFETLLPAIETAIARVPQWMRFDLRFKFQEVSSSSVRNKMVEMIMSTPKKFLDEVAFVLTYLPKEVLNSSRFANDWEYILHNAQWIYQHADSLKYVRLVEIGDTNSGDWCTTTEYRIKNGSNYFWRAIDNKYYYQFIVMPKLEQEGLYVTDNNTSISAERTWGYFWRDYLWNDYSSAVNPSDEEDRSYHEVNMSGYIAVDASGSRQNVTIDTIPRFGELMQMPEYLWNETPTIYFFNRDFNVNQGALDVLGNWASRCVPQDVTSSSDYRPSQPNHIAWKHVGNCHEDALLVAAAARTALIPCMHVADLCDDHVWTVIHDGSEDMEWHHFEFFRGGLSSSRPYYWGMTNMQETGNYGWNSSLVQGFVPNGTMVNLSEKYSENDACTLNMTITDPDGVPVDGAKVQIYSTNYQYSSTDPYVMSAGYLWTDAKGQFSAKLGTGNKYYMKVSHPKFGSFPETSGQVYNVLTTKTTAGHFYSKEYSFPTNPSALRNNIMSNQMQYDADKSVKVTLSAKNITVGNNPEDGQYSSFYECSNTLAGLQAYVVDDSNIDFFKNGNLTATAEYDFGTLSEGTFSIPVHISGTTYLVLSNSNNYTNYVDVEYNAELVGGADFDHVGLTENILPMLRVYPSPAQDFLWVECDEITDKVVSVFDISGKIIMQEVLNNISAVLNVSHLNAGIYFVKIGAQTVKFVKQ